MPRPAPRPSPLPQLDDTSSSSDEALTKKRVVRESSSTRPLQPTKRVRGKAPSSTPEPHAPKSKPLSNSSAAPALSIRDTPQSSARPKYTTAIAIQDTPEVGDVQIVTNNSASSPEHTPTHPRASKTGAVRATFGKNISPTTASAGDLEEHASTAAGAAVEIVDSSDFSDGDSLDSGYDKALRCPSCQRHLSDSLSAKAMDLYSHLLSLTPGSEQYYMQGFEFCRRHKAEETTIPEGIRRGYPTSIDFKRIKMRVRGLLSEIKGIVSNPETSYFRTLAMQAYSSLGKRHAQGVEYKLRHSQQLKCGYYGMLGTSIIFKTLIELLTRGEKPILKYRTTKPQTVFEFIQDVLVPEVASRLILQDCQSEASRIGDVTNLAEARQVMQESSEFGWALHGDWSDEESSD
ncbi:RTC4-like domain-containing protein [Polychytrium aggregatum]|uniref:RTC4-like domain-containing protein n=1 Tax=Polychytrium aggregatum TaxID=110093 RepID=UPI0022FDE975|nr:RTC4-like domain-containing protein [Polychytrium aggregatum]KAI9207331.1 RTC4-like domain-containing protein [Polychytrium aggregatum]